MEKKFNCSKVNGKASSFKQCKPFDKGNYTRFCVEWMWYGEVEGLCMDKAEWFDEKNM